MSFASRVRKLASETAIYGVSSVVGRLVTFLLVPFYTQFFAPDLYGVIILVYTAFVFLNIVYTYGVESAYLKFASGSEGRERVRETFSVAVWSLAGSSLLLSALIVLFDQPVITLIGIDAQWTFLLYYAVAILTLDTLAVVPFAELRLSNRPIVFAGIKLANILTNVGLNIFLIVGLRKGIESILIANLAASALSLVLLVPVFVRLLRAHFSSAFWRTMMRFGLPFLPGGLGYALTDRVNLFFLGRMSPESVERLYGDEVDIAATAGTQMVGDAVYGQYVAGVFGTVWKLGIFMMLLVQMFRFAWQPFFLQHAEDEDAKPLFARVFTLFTGGALIVFLGVSFLAEELVAIPLPGGRTIIERSYWLGLPVVPIALTAYFFQGWYYLFSAGAYIEKKTIHFVWATLAGGTVALVLNALLVSRFGMMGAAWATAAAYAVMALVLGAAVQRFYYVPYEWKRVIGLIALSGVLFTAWWVLPGLQAWVWEIVLILVFGAGAMLLAGLSPSSVRRLLGRESGDRNGPS